MTRYATVLAWALIATTCGCSSLSISGAPVKGDPTSTREIANTPISAPTIFISTDHDRQRLIVRITQPFEMTFETQTPIQLQAQRYVFSPIAPLAGAIHCPIVGLMYGVSAGHLGSHSVAPACRRLLMQEPLAGSQTFAKEIEYQYEVMTRTMPVPYATLTVTWDHSVHPTLSFDGNNKGEIVIPQRALLPSLESNPPSLPTLSVMVDNRVVWTHRLVTDDLMVPGPWQDANHSTGTAWPQRLAVVVEPLNDTAPAVLKKWVTLVTRALLERNICVVAPATFTKDLQDELLLHQSGRISDHTTVQFGKWIPASVALAISIGGTDQQTATLEFLDIQKAERLRHDVLRYDPEWQEDAQMLKAYVQTIFPDQYHSCS